MQALESYKIKIVLADVSDSCIQAEGVYLISMTLSLSMYRWTKSCNI